MSFLVRFVRTALLIALLASACTDSTPTPTPTPPPSLNTSLWMDFPTIRAGRPQSANVVVNDPTGHPVPGGTAILVIQSTRYRQTYTLPLTDSEGRSRIDIPLPPITANQTFTVTVTVVDQSGHWDEAVTTFEVYP